MMEAEERKARRRLQQQGYRATQKVKAKERAYRSDPEIKAKKKASYSTPEYRAKERARHASPEYKAKRQAHLRARLKNNIQARLSHYLRRRVLKAIAGDYKAGSAVRDLGCSIAEFKAYIEAQFLPGMTWNNWSPSGWHLDHIRPLASFDLTDREQFLQACHYTNYQPLWALDNLRKGAWLIP